VVSSKKEGRGGEAVHEISRAIRSYTRTKKKKDAKGREKKGRRLMLGGKRWREAVNLGRRSLLGGGGGNATLKISRGEIFARSGSRRGKWASTSKKLIIAGKGENIPICF